MVSEPRAPGEGAPEPGAATRELRSWIAGDAAAAGRLLPLVYDELRRLAGGVFRGRASDEVLQPTALVHEAWLRLAEGSGSSVRDREHFLALAATAMRHVLADHARRGRALKRGGGAHRETRVEPCTPSDGEAFDLLLLDEVLTRLEAVDPRQHRIVELRFFAGLEMEEIARALDLSVATVEREWRAARAWLGARIRELGGR